MSEPYAPSLVLGWSEAKRETPSRLPYSFYELAELRVRYSPIGGLDDVNAREATVIWTLLDMLEEQLGFRVPGDSNV